VLPGREEYVPPVGFAREPRVEHRRWVARIVLIAFVLALGWVLLTRVVQTQDDNRVQDSCEQGFGGRDCELPAPI